MYEIKTKIFIKALKLMAPTPHSYMCPLGVGSLHHTHTLFLYPHILEALIPLANIVNTKNGFKWWERTRSLFRDFEYLKNELRLEFINL